MTSVDTQRQLADAYPDAVVFTAAADHELTSALAWLRRTVRMPELTHIGPHLAVTVRHDEVAVWRSGRTPEQVLSIPSRQLYTVGAEPAPPTDGRHSLELEFSWGGHSAKIFVPVITSAIGHAARHEVESLADRVIAKLAYL